MQIRRESKKYPWLAGALLSLLVLAAYYPTFSNGYIWDDDFFVTNNAALRSFSGLGVIWTQPRITHQYYPATFTTLWLEYRLWAGRPAGYHLVNVLLHLCNALLFWRLLRRLRIGGALLAGAIFAVHPVYVESVAWISELKNTQSTLFYLLAFHAYLRAGFTNEKSQRTSRGLYWLSLALFIFALFSKTVAGSLPAAILLVHYWKNGRVTRRDVMPLIPFFAAAVGLGLLTAHLEASTVGAAGSDFHLNLLQRCVVAGRAAWFYLWKLLWPAHLTFIYPRWTIQPVDLRWLLFPLSAATAVLALWLVRCRVGRGPLCAVLFFAGTLFPALGFINVFPMVYSFVADHFQYLASIGIVALLASGLWRIPGKVPLSVLLLCVLTILTNRQCRAYHDSITLWHDTLSKNRSSWMAELNLGNALLDQDRVEEAEKEYQRASAIDPNRAEPWWDWGVAEARQKHYDAAIELYQHAIRIEPRLASAYMDMGNALVAQDKIPQAIDSYQKSLEIAPDMADAHFALGLALEKQSRRREAMAHYATAIRVEPSMAKAHFNLAFDFKEEGHYANAAVEYYKAIGCAPRWAEAHASLAAVELALGNVDTAIQEFGVALQIAPDLQIAKDGLNQALERKRRPFP